MEENPAVLYRTDIDVWMRGMDYKQADSKEIGSRRNVVSQKNASNSMDSKEKKSRGFKGGGHRAVAYK